jgi:hypothetical protein
VWYDPEMRYQRQPISDRIAKMTTVDSSGCWNWTGQKFWHGYGRMKIARGGGVYQATLAHRVSYEEYKGAIPHGLFVLHSCHNRLCCNPEHLHLGTHEDNMRERDDANRTKSGADVYNFLRTQDVSKKAGEMRAQGLSVDEVAKALNISRTTYYRMRRDGAVDPVADKAARSHNQRLGRAKQLGRV